ncbi:hypothetical protein [Jatrophihabitans lederbergiae]|uniref:Uncharacterized protein n=1 Tax=Jatrophihabitans lederbergiae TaxID=3075547 RepID=A0ABU2JDD0_9ACTN|nr:hypothetical protein [Jatrophihabitans sp. DSM 44399]MDT0262998.1 hypothetical protein [Jatrophihabitans sp. DSM 44399]
MPDHDLHIAGAEHPARSTNDRASTARVWARTSRAVAVHDVTAIAMVIEVSPCPITADSEMAGGRLGSAMNPKSRTR